MNRSILNKLKKLEADLRNNTPGIDIQKRMTEVEEYFKKMDGQTRRTARPLSEINNRPVSFTDNREKYEEEIINKYFKPKGE